VDGKEGGERRERGTKSQRGGKGTKSRKEKGGKAVYDPPDFLVTPLLMGPVCLLSQGRLERASPPRQTYDELTAV